jgi:hypothetical protein
LLAFFVALLTGCSGDPPLHPVTGKVTLGGKSYERLLIYMDPIDAEVTPFNKGVGETDVKGEFEINSTASTPEDSGLAAGEYRVYFNCWMRQGSAVGLTDEKPDERNTKLITEDIVPPPYNDPVNSPVTFEVESGENVFEFDIPANGPGS